MLVLKKLKALTHGAEDKGIYDHKKLDIIDLAE
jgi:hypothetical protein